MWRRSTTTAVVTSSLSLGISHRSLDKLERRAVLIRESVNASPGELYSRGGETS